MTNNGWVKLYRKLEANPVWTQLSPAVLKVMIGMLLKANFEPSSWYDGISQVSIPAGCFVCSYANFAKFCHLTIKQVRCSLTHLEKIGFSKCQHSGRHTLIQVCNWDTYQTAVKGEERLMPENRILGHDVGHDVGHSDEPCNPNKHIDLQPTSRDAGHNLGHDVGQGEGTIRAATGQQYKNIRREEVKTPPSAVADVPSDPTSQECLFDVSPAEAEKDRKRKLQAIQQIWFDCFWSAYWLRAGKKPAGEKFRSKVTTLDTFNKIMAAVKAQYPAMIARDPEKRPHASTWLHQERWDDEVPGAPTSTPRVYDGRNPHAEFIPVSERRRAQ